MNMKYEYTVKAVTVDGVAVQAFVENRREAREMKRQLKGECTDVKIVQSVYKLDSVREVR